MIIQIGDVNAVIPIKTDSQKSLLLFSPVNCSLSKKHQASVTKPKIETIGKETKTIVANKSFWV